MKEIQGNFWILAQHTKVDAICVTTNGIIKKDGSLVMGKGIALDFAIKFPELPKLLGQSVQDHGNICWTYRPDKSKMIISFPTKNHWKDKSNIELIRKSAKELVLIANNYNLKIVLLTRPGCGNGGLNWEQDVKPVIEPILDDRFFIVSPEVIR